ncbi:hypothetical protein TcWFU_010369 [Taenia crassiceps]|uniref:Uncharacterized protein n=1 Tax=Taenia crassiceps TaxID=6207 RepID=A0ABR4Q6A7_9CEST
MSKPKVERDGNNDTNMRSHSTQPTMHDGIRVEEGLCEKWTVVVTTITCTVVQRRMRTQQRRPSERVELTSHSPRFVKHYQSQGMWMCSRLRRLGLSGGMRRRGVYATHACSPLRRYSSPSELHCPQQQQNAQRRSTVTYCIVRLITPWCRFV